MYVCMCVCVCGQVAETALRVLIDEKLTENAEVVMVVVIVVVVVEVVVVVVVVIVVVMVTMLISLIRGGGDDCDGVHVSKGGDS